MFEDIFRANYDELYRHAHMLLKDTDAAEDAVQDVFVYLMTNEIEFSKSIRGYLHTAVHHRCLQLLRKEKVRIKYTEWLERNEMTTFPDLDLEPDATNSFVRHLEHRLEQLAPGQRAAFNLVHSQQKKYKEAANLLGISVNSLKTNLKFAIKHLKKCLQ